MPRKLMVILAGLVALGLVLLVFGERWLYLIGDYLVVEDSLQPADVIHVIAGEDFRTEYAIQLFQEGYAGTLFFTGGWWGVRLYYHGQHAKELSLAAGVPARAIVADDSTVTSSYMEAERLKEWIDRSPHPVHSVIVVSDPFHMRRVSWMYRWVLGDQVRVQLAPVPFERTPYQRAWWKDPVSRDYVWNEYEKLVYYLLRYRLSGGIFKNWLISLDRE